MEVLLQIAVGLLFFRLFTTETLASAALQGLRSLSPGDSLSVENEEDFLISTNGTFTSGFYKVGTNAYCYSIWFTNSADRTVTWMANRDRPVQGKQSKLIFEKNRNLLLADAYGTIIWQTNTYNQEPVRVQLQETGNLVLLNQTGGIIWGSFDSPTDTLLPHQSLRKASMLVSARGPDNYSSGYYNFHFTDNNILSLIYNGPELSSIYWPNPDVSIYDQGRTPYDSSRNTTLDEHGYFMSTDNLNFNASDYGLGPKRRLTLDYDGMLRLYSLDEAHGSWNITWSANIDVCNVRGLCGKYGICVYAPKPSCMCPPGFQMTDPSDWSKGCSPKFNPTCNDSEFVQLFHTDYYGYDLVNTGIGKSFAECKNICLANCNCKGFSITSIQGRGIATLKAFYLMELRGLQSLSPGDSLAVEKEEDFLISPSGAFSSGFYKVGTNAYCYSIWFTYSANRTTTWMANRNQPVHGKDSKLNFKKNGNLVLTDAYGITIWETRTFNQEPVRAELLDTGNLVLRNQNEDIIWDSFSNPTDTLLPHQVLTRDNMLVSAKGPNNYSSGYYMFHYDDDNILRLVYNGPEISSVYLPNLCVDIFKSDRTPYNSYRSATLDEQGHFQSSDRLNFSASDYGLGPKRRLTLDYDGMLRL
ncbi:hypothetical protein J5N97_002399 [Dioscorea zingiberensis]|uniref:Uncharacterized protein n=1 Tax=Dioscorea zingiberensis TaxID=325984 RepID=A0A9D5D2R8_9LILI|nr:hypothetical protein J5N97_002399 [Dioscorea zingiberensis]